MFEDLFAPASSTDDSIGFTDVDDYALEGAFLDASEELTPAAESAIFLETLSDSCDSVEEFISMVQENATQWEAYGIIDSAEVAMEAVKKITIDNWKQVNFERLWKREAIRIAQRANTSDYQKYYLYRTKMREFRQKIFDRHASVAKRNVKAAQHNSKSKASAMKTSHGNDLEKRIKSSMSKSQSGHNPTNAPAATAKKSAASKR